MHPGLRLALMLLGIGTRIELQDHGGLVVQPRERRLAFEQQHSSNTKTDQDVNRKTCAPGEQTKYKMRSTAGEMGKKFNCPPGDTIMSCRCPQTFLNGTKTGKTEEVPHPNQRVCSCRGVTCGSDCRKIVTRAVCCSKAKKCPVNSVQKPRHRRDWVCRIDVRRTFGVKTDQIKTALSVGMGYLRKNPREQVEIFFRKGTYQLDSGKEPTFWLQHVRPENNGRLIIAGAGMSSTTLKFLDWRGDMILGNNVSKITVRDLHLTRGSPGTTQGYVKQVTDHQVILEIPPGFPLPSTIHNGEYEGRTRTYLRKYINDTDPQLVMANNPQVPWTETQQVTRANEQLWAFKLRKSIKPNYQPGDLIGVKSKCCGFPRSCSYFFKYSREILFERVKWTRQSRGVFRLGTNDVTIKDCEISRDPPIDGRGWCLSSSGGGPQFGQPNDLPMHKVKVINFYAEGTGDDSLAFFNVMTNASVENARIRDAFARSILLHKSPTVKMTNVEVERSPICENNNEEEIRKIYDFEDNQRKIRMVQHFNQHRFEYDPDGLLGSNCTLQPQLASP